MLTELRATNYKSFVGSHSVELSPISVLLGKNNSGKTSLARLPLLLAGLLSSETDTGRPTLPSEVGNVAFPDPQDLVSGRMPHQSFAVGGSYDPALAHATAFDVELLPLQTLNGTGLWVSRLQLPGVLPDSLTIFPVSRSDSKSSYIFDGMLPVLDDARLKLALDEVRRSARRHLSHISHLPSIRQPVQRIYDMNRGGDRTDLAPQSLSALVADSELLNAVAGWYRDQLGMDDLSIDSGQGWFRFTVGTSHARSDLALAGQGVQQVLPVVTLLHRLLLRRTQDDLVILEEPELHLHPAAHPAVADLIVQAHTVSHSPMIIETHSENLCLRLRLRVANGELDPAALTFIWCDRDASPRLIGVNGDGSVDDWPLGVFSEDLAEVRAIARAQRS